MFVLAEPYRSCFPPPSTPPSIVLFVDDLCNLQGHLHVTVSALEAAAVVWMSELPSRLNPIILPLMASIKKEQVSL